MAIAPDAGLVAQRLADGLPKDNPYILHGVVAVDVEISLRGHLDVEATMARHEVKHVIQEAHTGLDARGALAVEADFHRDMGLASSSFHGSGARRHG